MSAESPEGWMGCLEEQRSRPTRVRFAYLPIRRYSSEFYRNSCYWLRLVTERHTPSGWKALEADNK